MSNNGGPAFPTENARQTGQSSYHYEGMTLRDYFAAKAMQMFLTNPDSFFSEAASAAYRMADEMLEARK